MSKRNMIEDQIKDIIYSFFIESHDFNGIPLRSISERLSIDYRESIDIIKGLIQHNIVSIQSSTNPHIIGFRHYPIDKQIEILDDAKNINQKTEKISGLTICVENTEYPICLYPSQDYLRRTRDLSQFGIAEYTKMLALGEPQLSQIFFEIEVLDRYFNDPRFDFNFEDYSGQISCRYDENNKPILREEDQIFLKTFGLGVDSDNNRLAVVFLRYLNDLTPEHQSFWKSKEVSGNCKIIEEYYDNAIQGSWTSSRSVFSAFIEEHHCLNELSKHIFGINIFNKVFIGENRPKEFTFFFSPTLKNYNEFILLLDKMISDNINLDFFKDKVDIYEYLKLPDNMVERKQKGTLNLFQEWLSSIYKVKGNDDLHDLFAPFKRVRRERQNPAHKIYENEYDKKYVQLQRETIQDCFESIHTLRMIFAKHPKAKDFEIPEYLENVQIKSF